MSGHPSILIITRHYSPEPTGSAPVLQEMAEWLVGSGRDVDVFTVRPSYPSNAIFAGYAKGERDDTIEGGVHVIRKRTSAVGAGSIAARIGPELGFLFDILWSRVSGNLRPRTNIISLCPSILTVLGALAVRAGRGRHIAVVHDIPSGLGAAIGGSARLVVVVSRLVEIWTLNRVDTVIALSAGMEQQLRAMGVSTPIVILPPHVNTELIKPMAVPAKRTVMYSGNLGRKQGLDQLLDAAAVLARVDPDVRVLIRGEGAERTRIADRIANEDLFNVELAALAPKEELSRSLSEGHLHVITQLPAGGDFAVPSKAFAIMSAGRPFVATAEHGSPLAEMAIKSGAGICCAPGRPEDLASTILGLLNDRKLAEKMGRQGRAFVEREASTDVVMQKVNDLLLM